VEGMAFSIQDLLNTALDIVGRSTSHITPATKATSGTKASSQGQPNGARYVSGVFDLAAIEGRASTTGTTSGPSGHEQKGEEGIARRYAWQERCNA
jgi:hypothetical protein